MSSFIEKQQYREDQLREHCNLQNFIMKDKPGYYDTIIDSIKQQITTTIYKNLIPSLNPSQVVSTKLMEADSYDELMNMSYSPENEGKEIIYEEHIYILDQCGIKVEHNDSYSNQQYYEVSRNPQWSLTLGNHTLTITDIK